MPAEATAVCPKHMTYGPCGGVRDDGACEIDASLPCPFIPMDTVRWVGSPTPGPLSERSESKGAPAELLHLLATRPIVVADLPARALDTAALAACADILRDHVDAVLAGDSGSARVQFPPAYRARLVLESGLLPWVGLNCRDRNRVAIEAELVGLAQVGVAAVHCVTGDHTDLGDRPDARPVFDLDSTRLASLARSAGQLVSVAENPVAPPIERRPARLLEKERAGAQLCFVNHSGGVAPVAEFIARSRALGVTLDFIPCVPIILDEHSAALIRSFTGLALPPGYVESILESEDSRAAGIEAAARFAAELLEIDGVVGVNLSGGPLPGGELGFAEGLAEISERILGTPRGRAA